MSTSGNCQTACPSLAGAFRKSTKRVPRTTVGMPIGPIIIGLFDFSTNPRRPRDGLEVRLKTGTTDPSVTQ